MVDIDEEVVKICQKYLTEWNKGVYEDKRMNLIFDDINNFLNNTNELFDVIILDVFFLTLI
jgi:spermidine synthase